MFHHLVHLVGHLCQFASGPGRTRQRVEQHKSKSTQPRFARRWATLYTYMARKNSPGLHELFRFRSSFQKHAQISNGITISLLIYRADDVSDTSAALHRPDGAADGVADPPDDPCDRPLSAVAIPVTDVKGNGVSFGRVAKFLCPVL